MKNQSMVICLFLCVMMSCFFAVTSLAAETVASGKCGENLTWTLDALGKLTIEGAGAMTDWTSKSSVPWYANYDSIQSVEIRSGVTSIGNCAFYFCKNLTSVVIPAGVTSIGSYVFSNCESLTSIDIPAGVTNIGSYAFSNCDSLTRVDIPASVTSIGSYAFSECDSLTSIDIPVGVTTIGARAFVSCDRLTRVDIPDSVTVIGDGAFSDCESLTKVTIGNSVTIIGDCVFGWCKNLTSIDVSNANTAYSSQDGVLYNKEQTMLIQCPGGKTGVFTIPNNITVIGDNAFFECDSLTSVDITDSVTSIGDYAFFSCNSLTNIAIPDSVTGIGSYAFYGCESLTRVDVGNSVKSIVDHVFCYCKNLMSVDIPDSITKIGEYAFDTCESLTDVHYNGSKEEWGKISIKSGNTNLTGATIHFLKCFTVTEVLVADDNKLQVIVALENPVAQTIIMVGTYDASGRFINLAMQPISDGAQPDVLLVDAKNVSEIKTMLWNGIGLLAPLSVPDTKIIE